jgi:hypothetical protein
MAEYCVVMFANKKPLDEVTKEMEEIITGYDPSFTDWLAEESNRITSGSEDEETEVYGEEGARDENFRDTTRDGEGGGQKIETVDSTNDRGSRGTGFRGGR